MGFSTNITIQNDFWHEIKKDPQKLVDAITQGMNMGAGNPDPFAELLPELPYYTDEQREFYHAEAWRQRFQIAPQGVTVHKAEHNDVPQVICSTYGRHAIAAHELPSAISRGWLDLSPYNERRAEAVAEELDRLAVSIRYRIRKAKSGKDTDEASAESHS